MTGGSIRLSWRLGAREEGRDKEGGGEGRDGMVGISSSTSVASLSSTSFFCGFLL